MDIELNESWQKALDQQKEEPLRIVDPRNQKAYVLLPAEMYDQLRCPTPADENASAVAPGVSRSREAFLRDLPQLLADAKQDHWWAAYHGDLRIGIAHLPQELLREIIKRGIPSDQYFLGVIRTHDPEPEEIELRHGHHFEPLPSKS